MNSKLNYRSYRDFLNQQSGIFDSKFFFILGMPKSGTTWLQLIMDAHPDVLCRGESNFEKRLKTPLAEAITRFNQLASKGGLNQFGENEFDALYMTSLLMIMNQWLEGRDAKPGFIGERTPNFMAKRINEWRHVFPDARFIHVVRDPRDVAVSGWFFWLRKRPEKTLAEFGKIETFARFSVGQWFKQMDKLRSLDASVFEVRYEELLKNNFATVMELFKFIGASASTELVADICDRTSFESLSGRSSGDEDQSGSKFRKGVIGDWKNHLCESVFLPYSNRMAEYGY